MEPWQQQEWVGGNPDSEDATECDYLSDIQAGIESIEEQDKSFQDEALELLRGMLEELQAIRNAIPSFHEGVNAALELRREMADEEAQKEHDEMIDAMEDRRRFDMPLEDGEF